MNDKNIALMLEKLAAQLGTTVEYLWGILVKQAAIEADIAFTWAVIGWAVTLVGVVVVTTSAIKYNNVRNEYSRKADLYRTMFCISLFLVVTSSAIATTSTISYVRISRNPEWWALKQVMDMLN